MTKKMEILKKLAMIDAQKVMKEFKHLQIISYENWDSDWIEHLEKALKKNCRIANIPNDTIPIKKERKDYLRWLKENLKLFKDVNEWLISVPAHLRLPVWVNVNVVDYEKAIEEIWDYDDNIGITIVDKITGNAASIYEQEYEYIIFLYHIG